MSNNILNFRNYEVEKMILEKIDVTKDIIQSENSDNRIGFLLKIVPNKNSNFNKVNIYQGISIEPSEEFPYKLEVILRGNFVFENSNDEGNLKVSIKNATAILFPYLRATVSLLTSQIDVKKIILPVMNFSKVFEDVSEKELIYDEKLYKDF